jgi:hypothetical protein
MKSGFIIASIAVVQIVSASSVFAQGFGEYGRAVGSIPHGQGITGGRPSGGVTQGGVRGGTVGESEVRGLPARLVVAVNDAGLFPSQDDQSEKLGQLNQGEILTPMIQSAGGNDWFMVKTQKGIIGWIKSSDVRAAKIKK